MLPPKITPMIKQYLSIKKDYSDAILFYRMGDFYEMFFEDAQIASKLLEITLTSRNKKDKSPIPMCGVPFRSAQGYIARLINSGHKVAICDQLECPVEGSGNSDNKKGLVKREVVRVVTPGMILENELLDEKTNNFILAVARDKDKTGISYLDISTGTFCLSESDNLQSIIDEIKHISPSELLISDSLENDPFAKQIVNELPGKYLSTVDNNVFDYRNAYERLVNQFKIITLAGLGCENFRAGISAAGALLYYVGETQKQKVWHLTRIETYELDNHMVVDETSVRNLELVKNILTAGTVGTLIGVIDGTVTAMGGRLLKKWLRYPLLEADGIEARLDAVEEAKEKIYLSSRVRDILKSVYDLERLGSRISMGRSNARDLTALKSSLQTLPEIYSLLSGFDSNSYRCTENTGRLDALAQLIESSIRRDAPLTINEGEIIKQGYNSELDELINISRDAKGWLAKLEAREKEATGITALKVRFNKVFGYYIEIPKSRADKVPEHYIRKQTLVNAERYISDELKTFELRVLGAEDKRAALEYEIFNSIRKEVAEHNQSIQKAAEFLSRLDCLLNLAHIAEENNYCRPEINTAGPIIIEDGRHPVVEKMITGEHFVPNTVRMDNEKNQVLIITGPNMAGKSTVLRQVALIVIMAQMGSFVPAQKSSISITDRIFTRVGALDNLSSGHSTFMVEMQETARILNGSTGKSLVIMDEIGRGTSTFDGLSIAWAVAEYLHDLKGCGVKTLFATHYHELTELENIKHRVKNFNISVKKWKEEIIFLRKLVKGCTNKSYGIEVARLAGIPCDVIKRSKKILDTIENSKQGLRSLPVLASDEAETGSKYEQLDLFNQNANFVVKELQEIDIPGMTPLEALNCLSEMHEKVKKCRFGTV